MDDIDYRVLRILAEKGNSRALIRDEEEKLSLLAMALYIGHPVSDVYDMPDGAVCGRITDAGRRELKKHDDALIARTLRETPP